MDKGLGSVTITGNHLIFNCVISPGPSKEINDDLQLMSMSSSVKGTQDTVASNKISAINRRRMCSSTVYSKDTVIDSSTTKQSELQHILCDSTEKTERPTEIQTKGKPCNHLPTSCTIKWLKLLRPFTSETRFLLFFLSHEILSASFNRYNSSTFFRVKIDCSTVKEKTMFTAIHICEMFC